MGFLDNSGDIILDAVLTDEGRQKMANGTFAITKFAMGDDEIDYGLYQKNHASGSAYADLDILQTPIFEAFTGAEAGINYGLLSLAATDILYMPVMKINELTAVPNIVRSPTTPTTGMFYLADASPDTYSNLLPTGALGGADKFLVSNGTDGQGILFETGLDTTLVAGDATNKSTYLVSNNLVDSSFFVSFDNRFIVSCLGGRGQTFNNTTAGDGIPKLTYALRRGTAVNTDLQLSNYSTERIVAGNNGVVADPNYGTTATTVSVIAGPRAAFGVLGFVVKANLDSEFTLYGAVNQTPFADGKLYSYIDTTVYVKGTKTGCQVQIPLRIIKYISG